VAQVVRIPDRVMRRRVVIVWVVVGHWEKGATHHARGEQPW
jgi:hypothetical protein